jgi:hypothetical protein
MSESPPPVPPPKRDGSVGVLLIIAGFGLVLPGLCTQFLWHFDLFGSTAVIFVAGLAGMALMLTGFMLAVLRFAAPQRNSWTAAFLILASFAVGFFVLTRIWHVLVPR